MTTETTQLRDELAKKEASPYNETKEARELAFKNGWDAAEEKCKPDWFKAGGMAERILIDWEMKQMKSKLNDVTTNYAKSVLSCDALQQENNELKSKQIALEQRIKMLVEKAECQNQ